MDLKLRTIEEITQEIVNHESHLNHDMLIQLTKTTTPFLELIPEIYAEGLRNAYTHRGNRKVIDELEAILWASGHPLNLLDYGWFQFGLPKLRAVSKEFKLAWPTNKKIKLMVNGKPCQEKCFRCVGSTNPPIFSKKVKPIEAITYDMDYDIEEIRYEIEEGS